MTGDTITETIESSAVDVDADDPADGAALLKELQKLEGSSPLHVTLDGELRSAAPPAVARRTWAGLLDRAAVVLPFAQKFWDAAPGQTAPAAPGGRAIPGEQLAAEVFLAIPVTLMIRELTARVVRSLQVLFASLLLLIVYQMSFQVYPERAMTGVTWAYVLVAIGAALGTVVSAERDVVLSRLSGTPPGRIQWDSAFVSRTLLPLLFALLTLLAMQFPELGNSLIRWLRPIQTALP
jgi:hypothetical protein